MDKKAINENNGRHFTKEDIHRIACTLTCSIWDRCKLVENIVENNPYNWLDEDELKDLHIKLMDIYSLWLHFSVYEVLIDHLEQIQRTIKRSM